MASIFKEYQLPKQPLQGKGAFGSRDSKKTKKKLRRKAAVRAETARRQGKAGPKPSPLPKQTAAGRIAAQQAVGRRTGPNLPKPASRGAGLAGKLASRASIATGGLLGIALKAYETGAAARRRRRGSI